MKKIRILIAEDNRVLRDGLIALLKGQSDMRVVAEIGSSNNLFPGIRKARPELILLDLSLWRNDPLSLLEGVRRDFPGLKVITMGLVPSQADVVESIEAGASGFILKDATMKEFLATIRTVAHGGKVLPPMLTGSLFSHIAEFGLAKRRSKSSIAVRMTRREREIVALIAEGLSNKEIAQRLDIKTYTVKSHVHNILEKLALHSRLQIAQHTGDGADS